MISVQPKLEAIHQGFAEVAEVLKPEKLDKYILSRLGAGVKTASRRAIKQLVKQRSGAMYKGVYSYYNKSKRQQIVTNNAQSSRGVRYPWILAAGHRTIKKTNMRVNFGVRDWVERPGNQYIASNKADDDIEKVLNREIEKLRKRGVIK